MGSQDTLEEKTVTVCYGSDFVNVNFVNFSCTKKEIAQVSIVNSLFICGCIYFNYVLFYIKSIQHTHMRRKIGPLCGRREKNNCIKHVLWEVLFIFLWCELMCVCVCEWNLIIFLFFLLWHKIWTDKRIPERVKVSEQLFRIYMKPGRA